MKTILGIIGSPRKLGNCEIMVKEISRNITEPHDLRLLRLTDFDIRPCTGCYACLFQRGRLRYPGRLPDGRRRRPHRGRPDRLGPHLFPRPQRRTQAIPGPGYRPVSPFGKTLGKARCRHRHCGHSRPGGIHPARHRELSEADAGGCQGLSALLRGSARRGLHGRVEPGAAKEIAHALFTPPAPKSGPHCPLCGGDTFRFLGENRVRCMLCSNAGTIRFSGDTPVLDTRRGDHELFLTREDAVAHREWLVGMKARFMAHKNELKQISTGYRHTGTWVQPAAPDPKSKSE